MLTLWWADVAVKEAIYDEVLGVNVRLHASVKVSDAPVAVLRLTGAQANRALAAGALAQPSTLSIYDCLGQFQVLTPMLQCVESSAVTLTAACS